jgi:hypothetical protein
MSDEKRREELKAIINEQLDKLSIEELEKVAGGYNPDDRDPYGHQYQFTKEEAEKLFHACAKGTGRRCPYCGEIV